MRDDEGGVREDVETAATTTTRELEVFSGAASSSSLVAEELALTGLVVVERTSLIDVGSGARIVAAAVEGSSAWFQALVMAAPPASACSPCQLSPPVTHHLDVPQQPCRCQPK